LVGRGNSGILEAFRLDIPTMSDVPSGRPRPSLLERLSAMLLRTPDDREQLLMLLRQSQERDLLDADAVSMIEGVLQVAELCAGDIMVPRTRMDVVDMSRPLDELLAQVIRTGRSRLPVIDGDRDNVVGILHAKDLIRLYAGRSGTVRELLRPATFVPESRRLNLLLRDFRANRTHLGVVVDEYGAVAGLLTIENVLEQIVGDIADEFDVDDSAGNVVALQPGPHGERWRVRALTPIAQLNDAFRTEFDDTDVDTVGGLVADRLGRVPRRGERIDAGGLRFEVLSADGRCVQMLRVERLPDAPAELASAPPEARTPAAAAGARA
jgi:magnesium and cobalt transporter